MLFLEKYSFHKNLINNVLDMYLLCIYWYLANLNYFLYAKISKNHGKAKYLVAFFVILHKMKRKFNM